MAIPSICLPRDCHTGTGHWRWCQFCSPTWPVSKLHCQWNKEADRSFHRIVQETSKLVQEEGFTTFTCIMEMLHFVSHLAADSPRMPNLIWDDLGKSLVLDGHMIIMTSFRLMYQHIAKETRSHLQNDVLLGLEAPTFSYHGIWDELSNQTVGYSFITDQRIPFIKYKTSLMRHLMDGKFQDRFYHQESSKGGTIQWNHQSVFSWFQACQHVLGGLFALLHYGAGQPARGTELQILTAHNTWTQTRNVFWFKGFLNIITWYNKTQTNSNKPRVILCSLPHQVADLFIIWFSFVMPTLAFLASNIDNPGLEEEHSSIGRQFKERIHRFQNFIFTEYDGLLSPDEFTEILQSFSGKSPAKNGLGYAMGLRENRHRCSAETCKWHSKCQCTNAGHKRSKWTHRWGSGTLCRQLFQH